MPFSLRNVSFGGSTASLHSARRESANPDDRLAPRPRDILDGSRISDARHHVNPQQPVHSSSISPMTGILPLQDPSPSPSGPPSPRSSSVLRVEQKQTSTMPQGSNNTPQADVSSRRPHTALHRAAPLSPAQTGFTIRNGTISPGMHFAPSLDDISFADTSPVRELGLTPILPPLSFQTAAVSATSPRARPSLHTRILSTFALSPRTVSAPAMSPAPSSPAHARGGSVHSQCPPACAVLKQPRPPLPVLVIPSDGSATASDHAWPIDLSRPLCHPPADTGLVANVKGAVAKSKIIMQLEPDLESLSGGVSRSSTIIRPSPRPSTSAGTLSTHPLSTSTVQPRSSTLSGAATSSPPPPPDGDLPMFKFDNPSPFNTASGAVPPFGYGSIGRRSQVPVSPGSSPKASAILTSPGGLRPPPRPPRSKLRTSSTTISSYSQPPEASSLPAPTHESPTFGETPFQLAGAPSRSTSPSAPADPDEILGLKTMMRKDSEEVAEQLKLAFSTIPTALGSENAGVIVGLPNTRRGAPLFVPTHPSFDLADVSHLLSPVQSSDPEDVAPRMTPSSSAESVIQMQHLHRLIHPGSTDTSPAGSSMLSQPATNQPVRAARNASAETPSAAASPPSSKGFSPLLTNEDTEYASIRAWMCTLHVQLQLLDQVKARLYAFNGGLIDGLGNVKACLQAGRATEEQIQSLLSKLTEALSVWWREQAQKINSLRDDAIAEYDSLMTRHSGELRKATEKAVASTGPPEVGDRSGSITVTVSAFSPTRQQIMRREAELQARLDERDLQRQLRGWVIRQVAEAPVFTKAPPPRDPLMTTPRPLHLSLNQLLERTIKSVMLAEEDGKIESGTTMEVWRIMSAAGWTVDGIEGMIAMRTVQARRSRPGEGGGQASKSQGWGGTVSSFAPRYESLKEDIGAPSKIERTLSKLGKSMKRPFSRGRAIGGSTDASDRGLAPEGLGAGSGRIVDYKTGIHSQSSACLPVTVQESTSFLPDFEPVRPPLLGRLSSATRSAINLLSSSTTGTPRQHSQSSIARVVSGRHEDEQEWSIPTTDAAAVRRRKAELRGGGSRGSMSYSGGNGAVVGGRGFKEWFYRSRHGLHVEHDTEGEREEVLDDRRPKPDYGEQTPTPRPRNRLRPGYMAELEDWVSALPSTSTLDDGVEGKSALSVAQPRVLSMIFDAEEEHRSRQSSVSRNRLSMLSVLAATDTFGRETSIPSFAPVDHPAPDFRPRRDTPPSDRSYNIITPSQMTPPEHAPGLHGPMPGSSSRSYRQSGYASASDGREAGKAAIPVGRAAFGRGGQRESPALRQARDLQGYSSAFGFVGEYVSDHPEDELDDLGTDSEQREQPAAIWPSSGASHPFAARSGADPPSPSPAAQARRSDDEALTPARPIDEHLRVSRRDTRLRATLPDAWSSATTPANGLVSVTAGPIPDAPALAAHTSPPASIRVPPEKIPVMRLRPLTLRGRTHRPGPGGGIRASFRMASSTAPPATAAALVPSTAFTSMRAAATAGGSTIVSTAYPRHIDEGLQASTSETTDTTPGFRPGRTDPDRPSTVMISASAAAAAAPAAGAVAATSTAPRSTRVEAWDLPEGQFGTYQQGRGGQRSSALFVDENWRPR